MIWRMTRSGGQVKVQATNSAFSGGGIEQWKVVYTLTAHHGGYVLHVLHPYTGAQCTLYNETEKKTICIYRLTLYNVQYIYIVFI